MQNNDFSEVFLISVYKTSMTQDFFGLIKTVDNFNALLGTSFGAASALCLTRPLAQNFNDLARHLMLNSPHKDKMLEIGKENLTHKIEYLPNSMRSAAAYILKDMNNITNSGFSNCPTLRLIPQSGYHGKIPLEDQEVHAFHMDKSHGAGDDRLVCSYTEPGAEAIYRHDAIQLKNKHFKARENAPVFRFSAGDIWRPLCLPSPNALVHRAPLPTTCDGPRLVLVC